MTGLLVSVRSAEEAGNALAGGADIIDVKEPSRGPLGPADPEVWQAVRSEIAGRAPCSVVLGELLTDPAIELAPQTAGFTFAKIGLAGCAHQADWLHRWHNLLHRLPQGVLAVPVAYADWKQASAPAPTNVLQLTAQASRLLVIDTFNKKSGPLTDLIPWRVLKDWTAEARAANVRLTLAGSLNEQAILKLLPLSPAYIGVRTAVCQNNREGPLLSSRVKALARRMRAAAHQS
jgi:uncharacterized protein (UPF0264 family)